MWCLEKILCGFRLNINICTKLNEINYFLWDLEVTTWLLRSLECAIYDGLEMKLKVTKLSIWDEYVPSMVQWWWWMICPSILCPVLSLFLMQGLERSSKVIKTVVWCVLLCFSFLWRVLKWVNFTEYDVWSSRGLERSPNCEVYGWSWKKQIPEGSLPWRLDNCQFEESFPWRTEGSWKKYILCCIWAGVLKGGNLEVVSHGE